MPTFCLWWRMRGSEPHLQGLIRSTVEVLGYELVGVEILRGGGRSLVRIYIDAEAGILVSDCERVSHQVSGLLDVEEPIEGEYDLEVSSPGLDRPLFVERDFERFAGAMVRVKLRTPLDGQRRFRGRLGGMRDGLVVVIEGDVEHKLPFERIQRARLVPEY